MVVICVFDHEMCGIVKKVSCFGMSKVRPYERKRECV